MSRASDEAMRKLCEVLAAEIGAGVEFEVALGDMVGRYRLEHEKRMRDAQAASLLPLGRVIAAERLGVAKSTVYKMAHRWRKRSTAAQAT